MVELFQNLKQLRTEKGIPLADIARKYRIQIKYLEAIEQGRLQDLPAAYDHLFFRSYLKALAVDEEEYMEQFYNLRNQFKSQAQEPVISSSKNPVKREALLDYKSMLKFKNFFIFIPFLLILVILVVLLSSTKSVQTEANAPIREIDVHSIAASLQPPVPTDTADTSQSNGQKLSLLIVGLKNTWFRIVSDKRDTAEYMLKRGNQMTAQAGKTFEFVIGRADGLQFTLNDRPAQRVSTDSLIVSYLLIDSSGISVRRLKPPKPLLPADSISDSTAADSTHETD